MSQTSTRRLWVAYGPAGAVGKIQKDGDGYTVQMAGADAALGTYPSMDIAKRALQSHLKPGAEPPEYREH
ncbi:methyltransferase [Microbacterium lushaniae]|uniref:Methyltransferase n=1 Tax=Microbacterium lushaniae TaxID=2614639 RepID=A0A5J5JCG4_9MICO|nr:methyltransferase [Microbacterium lushaniae]KAA9148754.1 methyltransferase [Microbacterium lushaniae]KAA9150690.1 methyltransferase [Microbacterium lushaniae]QEW03350.1 methyltransferase [Microbacterium lushaniae]